MDSKEAEQGDKRKLRERRAYKWAARDLLVCQSFRSHPSPGEKRRERREEKH